MPLNLLDELTDRCLLLTVATADSSYSSYSRQACDIECCYYADVNNAGKTSGSVF